MRWSTRWIGCLAIVALSCACSGPGSSPSADAGADAPGPDGGMSTRDAGAFTLDGGVPPSLDGGTDGGLVAADEASSAFLMFFNGGL